MVMHAHEIRGEPSAMIQLRGRSSEMPARLLAERLSLRGRHISSGQNLLLIFRWIVYFISMMLKSEGGELIASKSINCIYLLFLFLLMKLLVQQSLAVLHISSLAIKNSYALVFFYK